MIKTHWNENVLEICIDRAEKKNALSHVMYDDLTEAIAGADRVPTCQAIIVYGAGGIFTAGADIKDFQKKRDGSDSPAVKYLRQLAVTKCPLIAAVEGFAIGIGSTMLQHFDFVYTTANTRFRMPFTELGLCPEGGSTILMERLVGLRKAMQWLVECQPFDGTEAVQTGFATALAEEGKTLERARATASNLAKLHGDAVRQSKHMLKYTNQSALTAAIDYEVQVFNEQINSDYAQKVFSKFLS
ncbi:enoyl-CoA hydratase/isomerase family protein [Alcaligenaceae bacterium]|nr:enoyl-CoA hydratase/isomerase family protein [Alcaligenaceae bacterium]